MAKTPLGRLDRSAFGMLELPRLEAGAIVDGAVRDIDHSREIGYLVWSTSVSPMTGKWRIRTVAVRRPGARGRSPGQARFRDAAEGLDQAIAFKITTCDVEMPIWHFKSPQEMKPMRRFGRSTA